MNNYKHRLGKWGEETAANHLIKNGYIILDKNVRTGYGEIDIVARQGEVVVFVEVKTRHSDLFGPPEVSINQRKKERLIQSTRSFMQEHPELGDDWRIDVIAVQQQEPKKVEITHFEYAIFV